jgi:hypothetical protein
MVVDSPDWIRAAFLVNGPLPAGIDFPDWVEAIELLGGGPFTPNVPATVPDLYFWHDATLISGVADGALLSAWPTIVNAPTYSLGANAGFQPTYYGTTQSKLINGKAAVWFAGAQGMFISPVPAATNQPWTVYMVAGVSSTAGTQVLFDNEAGVTVSQLGVTGGGWYADAGNTLNGPAATTGAHLFIVTGNGTSSTLIVDGVTFSGNAGTNSISGLTIGADRLGVNFMTGFICEDGGYTRVLNVAELATLHSYAQAKWGTP